MNVRQRHMQSVVWSNDIFLDIVNRPSHIALFKKNCCFFGGKKARLIECACTLAVAFHFEPGLCVWKMCVCACLCVCVVGGEGCVCVCVCVLRDGPYSSFRIISFCLSVSLSLSLSFSLAPSIPFSPSNHTHRRPGRRWGDWANQDRHCW